MPRFLFAGIALAAIAAAPPRPAVLIPHLTLDRFSQAGGDLAFHPNGKVIAVSSRSRRWMGIRFWDVSTGKRLQSWEVDSSHPPWLAYSLNEKSLFSVSPSLQRIHWNLTTGKEDLSFPKGEQSTHEVMKPVFSADGKRIGGAGATRIMVWDAATGKELVRHKRNEGSRYGNAISHDLKIVAAGNHQDVDLWNVGTGKIARSFLDHPGHVRSLAFSPDDRTLAACCTRQDEYLVWNSEVWLWNVARGRRQRRIDLGNLVVDCVIFSPDGKSFAVAGTPYLSGKAQVRLFETTTGAEVGRVSIHGERSIACLAFRPDGKMLAAHCDHHAHLWKVRR